MHQNELELGEHHAILNLSAAFRIFEVVMPAFAAATLLTKWPLKIVVSMPALASRNVL